MFTDILTVIWKESREVVQQRPNLRGGWIGLVAMVLVFGILLPVQTGPQWITTPASLMVWIWVPYLLVSGVIADSVAGERERHTLETLLASRLPDTAILIGKIGAAALYGFLITLASILLGVLTVNLVHSSGQVLLYPLPTFLGMLALCFLTAMLAALVGVLFSMRAPSVRQAQQGFSLALFVVLIPILLFPMLPAGLQNTVTSVMESLPLAGVAVIAGLGLLILDAILLLVALARFRRERLILD